MVAEELCDPGEEDVTGAKEVNALGVSVGVDVPVDVPVDVAVGVGRAVAAVGDPVIDDTGD